MMESRVEVALPIGSINPFLRSAILSLYEQDLVSFSICYVVFVDAHKDLLIILDEINELKPLHVQERVLVSNIRQLSFQLNLVINSTHSTYLARMDADDLSASTRLRIQSEFLDSHQDYGLVGCRVDLIDQHGALIRQFPFIGPNSLINLVLPVFNPLCHPALMFRVSSLRSIGGYRFGRIHEDHDLFLDLLYSGLKMCNLPDRLFFYRRHNSQLTKASNAWYSFCSTSAILIFWFLQKLDFRLILGLVYSLPIFRFFRLAGFRILRRLGFL